MKVRMKTRMSGPQMSAEPGQVIEVDIDTARELLSGGYAEAVWDKPVETAQVEVLDRLVARRRKAKTQ